LSLTRAASGILEIAVSSMANAVRAVTTERGLDPRDFALVAYGGGGPPHAAAVARELAIKRVVIPVSPAHFSAFGMLQADMRRDYVLTRLQRLAEFDLDELESMYRQLELEGAQALADAGIPAGEIAFERAADMRYVGQEHSVTVPLPVSLSADDARQRIKSAFDEVHDVRYSHSAPEEPAEIVSLRVSAIGRIAKPSPPQIPRGEPTPPAWARRADRSVYLDDSGEPVSCSVYDRAGLLAGNTIEGPAIVEEAASTTIISSGDRLTVNDLGHLVIELGA
jgi:N-methylhydantoinase A